MKKKASVPLDFALPDPASCKHEWMGVLPADGVWKKVCFKCYQVLALTPAEVAEKEREIASSLRPRKQKSKTK